MRWEGRRESEEVEDRRGQPDAGYGTPGGGGGAGMALGLLQLLGPKGFLALLAIGGVIWLLGGHPLELIGLAGRDHTTQVAPPPAHAPGPGADRETKFVSVVLADTEDTWKHIFTSLGRTYTLPKLVLYGGHTRSACGLASEAVGPFYCKGDDRVYLDLGFFKELAQRFGAPGQFAQAYVIAHEIGHHVQDLLGILAKTDAAKAHMTPAQANALSVRVELQADCFAGIWAHYAQKEGLVEPGDIDQALNAASQIGDDTLQKESRGYVVPDSFTHGTSAQRQHWFKTGFDNGSLKACDTFAAHAL